MVSTAEDANGRSDLWKIWGGVVALTLIGFAIAWRFVEPGPPRTIRLATGAPEGAYYRFGTEYAEHLAASGLEVQIVETAGTVDNLGLLANGGADVAFVQGGVASKETGGIVGVASLYHEPLWVFARDGLDVARLPELAGLRVQAGPVGSGTRAVVTQLLAENGIDASTAELLALPGHEAAGRLVRGDIDAMLLVASPRSGIVEELMAGEGGSVHLLDMDRAAAYQRNFRFLRQVVVPEGLFDLRENRPDRDVRMLAPLATMAATESLHPAIFPLLIEAARASHADGGLFATEGALPSPHHLDFPIADSARRYFAVGPTFLYRWLPFRAAALIDRLKIMLLPLLTLLLPLFKAAPPLYRWRIRSKIFRWYRVLRQVEWKIRDQHAPADLTPILDELNRVETEVLQVSVPPSYMEELYNLQMHLERVKEQVERIHRA